MDLKDVFREAKFNLYDLQIRYDGGESSECQFDINPRSFLQYAKLDLGSNSPSKLINCISNAKRAIDSQTDCTNQVFGISFKNISSIQSFSNDFNISPIEPLKLRIINAIGIAPAKLIADARKIRNDIEHDYREPNEVEAINAVDIAELFLIANEYKTQLIESSLTITDSNKKNLNSICVDFITDKKIFEIKNCSKSEIDSTYEVNNNSIYYLYLLRLMNTIKEEFEATKCINLFFRRLELISEDRIVKLKIV